MTDEARIDAAVAAFHESLGEILDAEDGLTAVARVRTAIACALVAADGALSESGNLYGVRSNVNGGVHARIEVDEEDE